MPLSVRPWCAVLAFVVSLVATAVAGERAVRQLIDITVRDGKIQSASAESSGGIPVIRVRQGQPLVLRWRADAAMTIHLHGYEIETRVPRDGEATMDFIARAAGRFPVERHAGRGHTTLLYLEVRP